MYPVHCGNGPYRAVAQAYLCGHDHHLEHLHAPHSRLHYIVSGAGSEVSRTSPTDKSSPPSALLLELRRSDICSSHQWSALTYEDIWNRGTRRCAQHFCWRLMPSLDSHGPRECTADLEGSRAAFHG